MHQNRKRILQSPFIYVSSSTQTVLSVMICLLVPQLIMLFLTKSYASLFVLLSAVLASLLAEAFYHLKKPTSSVMLLIALLQGLLVGKYAFEGFAASWVNPVALAVAAAYFIYACPFPPFAVDLSILREKNAALSLIREGVFPISALDSRVTDFLNRNVFRHFGMEIPDGYVTLFWDSGSPIPAFRFNLLNLIASLIL
ncbi:MAG: hypothetical protein II932_02300, partial [Treponema sp.]|nr:hypothetical protein [Treponema sp.]